MKKRREKGIALIMVLGLLSVMTLLIGAAVASSQTLRFSTASITQMNNSVYYNESAMNRTIWLLMNDRTLFPDRSLKPENMQLIRRERFRADGMEHFIRSGGITLEVKIFDMNSGINISGFNPASAFSYLNQVISKKGESTQSLDHFKNRLLDYIDSDDLLRGGSMEKTDYESLGRAPLPRNAVMQFREEILWIPGCWNYATPDEDGILSCISLIPPRGLHFPGGRPNFFSASSRLIQDKCDFSEHELLAVLNCRKQIASGKATAEEAFRHFPLLFETLKKQFSLIESNYYTLVIRPSAKEQEIPRRTLLVSLAVSTFSGNRTIPFYQWRIF